jgi:imidazole glycerol-phosphate synthase subunit HisF
MRRIRVIPTLLIQNGGLVKSVKFKNHKYVGDPINAVKIFNEKEVDELVILDISATEERRGPSIAFIQDIISEAFMPLGYGGGIRSLDGIKRLAFAGVEKFVLNTTAFTNPQLISDAAKNVGSQSVVVSVDVRRKMFGGYAVYIENGKRNIGLDPVTYCKRMESAGAGEILLNSIDRDGTYGGYDLHIIKEVTSAVNIPVVVIGGASDVDDFREAVSSGASAVAAGSMFVYQRPHNAVLISYPDQKKLSEKFFTKIS